MTDYPYDEKFPYVVTWGNFGAARFSLEENADSYARETMGKVIDTTPAPKIPADAEFIHFRGKCYGEAERSYWYAQRYGHPANKVWVLDDSQHMEEDDLIEEIGDSEVVVLKRA